MLAPLRSWWRALTGQERLAEEMAPEMNSHIERHAADLAARGIQPGEALRQARIAFGSTSAAAEECREAVGLRWPAALARDLRYAVRVLRKSPTFTLAAAATLALSIGANTAIFSVVDAVLLRPLPYPHAERLVMVSRHFLGSDAEEGVVSVDGSVREAVRDNATCLDVAVYSDGSNGVNFAAGGRVQYLKQQRVGAGFFRVLGIAPVLGREFLPSEDRPGGPPVAVLSYPLWKGVLGGDPAVVGRTVNLRGQPYTVVGVASAGFSSSVPADLWTPLRASRSGEGGGSNYAIVGRLRPGVSWAQADGQVDSVGTPALRRQVESPSVHLRRRFADPYLRPPARAQSRIRPQRCDQRPAFAAGRPLCHQPADQPPVRPESRRHPPAARCGIRCRGADPSL